MIDQLQYFEEMKKLLGSSAALWQVTIIATDGSTPSKPGMKMLIPLNNDVYGNLGGGEMEHNIIQYVREQQPSNSQVLAFKLNNTGTFTEIQIDVNVDISTNMICGGSVEVFIEPLFKKEKLYIIGAGHCGKALSHLAKICGFYVILLDNRESVLSPGAAIYADRASFCQYHEIDTIIDFDDYAYIVIMTHGHLHDKEVLEYCVRNRFRYLGMIGSSNKVSQTFANMQKKGFTAEELAKVHAPIGLKIGSQTPYEIAVSILAELISVRSSDRLSQQKSGVGSIPKHPDAMNCD